MRTSFKRVLAGSAVLATLASGLILPAGAASAAPPGTPATGPVSLLPATGTEATSLTLQPTAQPAQCPGDSATDGYTYSTFIAPVASDPATFAYDAGGITNDPNAFPFFTATGGSTLNQLTAINTGQVPPLLNLSFGAYAGSGVFPDGTYNVGIACVLAGQTATFWASQISITNPGGVINFAPYVAPAPDAPTAVAATPGNGSAVVTFTPGATPGDTYEVSATDGVNTFTATGAASPITVTGLTNGTSYDVTVTATNGTGTSAASAPPATVVPNTTLEASNLTALSGTAAGEINLSWIAPASPTLTGYVLTVTPNGTAAPVAGSPFTVGLVSSFVVTGLEASQEYTFSLLPTTSNAAGETPVASSVVRTVDSAQVLQQVIQVTRPQGALILTQRCGVNNALPAEGVVAGFPGFPAVGAIPATADQTGTTPDIDLLTAGVQADPEFANYPFPSPATYPTRCIIDLGTASLLTTGDLAGQYYAADGALNEVTVVDTRDVDAGWTINGEISGLTEEDGDTFSGDLVGWSPVVSSTTDPIGTSTYDQIVTPGASIVPGTAGGLSDGEVLASANAGAGLGVAVLDARIKVLIPVSNDAGLYVGTLNLTVS